MAGNGVDYRFYQVDYWGDLLTEGAEFERCISRAGSWILSAYNPLFVPWEQVFDREWAFKMAICAVADEFKRREDSIAASGGLKSQTVGKWRQEFAGTPGERAFNARLFAAAGLYLPLKRGVWIL